MVALAALSSCSKDDPEPAVSFSQVTRNEANGLTLTVNNAPMLGMTVDFTPTEANQATLKVYNKLDLSAYPNVPEVLKQTIAGPGAIPGTAELTLPLTLEAASGATTATFQGSGTATYATYKYAGTISNDAIKLAFTDVRLLDTSLAGHYTLAPYAVNEDFDSDNYGAILSSPVFVNWESGASLNFLGSPMTPADLCKLLFMMPLINDMTMTVPQFMETLLKDLTLGEDGFITASYLDLDAENQAYLNSPANLAQYVVVDNSHMLFFLNPQAVIADASRAASLPNMNNLMANVFAQITPMLPNGVPLQYKSDANSTAVYLGTETLLPLLKTNVVPLLRNEALVNQLVEIISANEDMSFLAPLIPDMISSVADVIDQTTVLEIGLNLTPAK